MEVEERFPEIPFLRIRFEDIFSESRSSLKHLTEFLELPWRPESLDRIENKVDKYYKKTRLEINWKEIYTHPKTIDLALKYGYEINNVNPKVISKRYQISLLDKLVVKAKNRIGLLKKLIKKPYSKLIH
jgi:hypothetical protein